MQFTAMYQRSFVGLCLSCIAALPTSAEQLDSASSADKKYPQQVYWGDTHLHTSYSFDASMMGNKLLGPAEAYRFARGEEVKTNQGLVAKLSRPLDFLMVADHAEYLGLLPKITQQDPDVLKDPTGARWAKLFQQGGDAIWEALFEMHHDIDTAQPSFKNDAVRQSTWQEMIAVADRFNDPGQFTAFAGYEWTTMPGGNNLHRVVLFADDASKTGQPLDEEYAKNRQRWEPLYEVTQIKGDGETHPKLSPDDEFADFERLDKGNLLGTSIKAENNYWGKFSIYEPSPTRAGHLAYKKNTSGKLWDLRNEGLSASGYAAVWATENTRDAIFDAMKRREVYATTGSRMVVRFFASDDFKVDDIDQPNYVARAYEKGVPMGGELARIADSKSISFLVSAQKDPEGANLDRIQIVKGWLDADGYTHEKVYDVVWSGSRVPDETGKLPAVGNTVDLDNATWLNTIGATQLTTTWNDPDFDPNQSAFYYARVIEIPTPRWTGYDEQMFDYKLDRIMPAIVQERAYTSPIWYNPQ